MIPAGATITGATLKLTSFTGFAFDGDPDHHAIFLAGRLLGGKHRDLEHTARRTASCRRSRRPSGCCSAARSAHRRPSSARPPRSRRRLLRHARRRGRNFGSANLRTRVGAERAGDGKLSVEVFTIPCGTPFAVVCQNGQLEQSYFLRYYSKEHSVLNAPRLVVDYELPPPLDTPSLIRVVSTGGTGAFVIGRVDGASNLPLTLAASTAATCTRRRAPGRRYARRRGPSRQRPTQTATSAPPSRA